MWIAAAFWVFAPPSALFTQEAPKAEAKAVASAAQSTPTAQPSPSAPAENSGEAFEDGVIEPLSKEHVRWLNEVSVLMTRPERSLFDRLTKNYQREAFIRQFWRERDPYPQTARNELRERWDQRVAYARANFDSLADARAQIHLLHGEPARRVEVKCTTTRIPAEIWLYTRNSRIPFRVVAVFLRPRGQGPASLWHPGRTVASVIVSSARACINGTLLAEVISGLEAQGGDYEALLGRLLQKPRPRSLEWVSSFSAHTTDLPSEATALPASLEIDYLGKHQNRTVTQGLVMVRAQDAVLGDFGGYRSYNFQLLGDIVLDGQLLESFRYKFAFPASERTEAPDEALPMAFQRYLRPGNYELVLRLEDLNADRAFHRTTAELEVPRLTEEADIPRGPESEADRIFREATEAVALGENRIRIVPPSDSLQTGFVRFDTLVAGEEIERVVFRLDDKEILTKNSPPYNVEIDLGEFPQIHQLRVEGLDDLGRVLAEDERTINAGGYRFAARLIEPRRRSHFTDSLRARVEVQVPENETLERVEFFLNETLVATLYQEPFVQPISIEGIDELSYVRAVAYLADGNSTEDLVFINGPDVVEEVEVQFVELYATVLDRQGRLVEDLREEELVVEEGRSATRGHSLREGLGSSDSRRRAHRQLGIDARLSRNHACCRPGLLPAGDSAARSRSRGDFQPLPDRSRQVDERPRGAGRWPGWIDGGGPDGALRQRDVHALLLRRDHRPTGHSRPLGWQRRGEPLQLR